MRQKKGWRTRHDGFQRVVGGIYLPQSELPLRTDVGASSRSGDLVTSG